jgi:hypothetical protein
VDGRVGRSVSAGVCGGSGGGVDAVGSRVAERSVSTSAAGAPATTTTTSSSAVAAAAAAAAHAATSRAVSPDTPAMGSPARSPPAAAVAHTVDVDDEAAQGRWASFAVGLYKLNPVDP